MITEVLPAVLSFRYQGRHRRQEVRTVLRSDSGDNRPSGPLRPLTAAQK
ncbi:hypothetical protein [Nonomuraea sp. 10N515B]